MDPLSITVSALALAAAANHIGIAISRLRDLGELPGKLYALKNDVSDLEVVLRQTANAVQQNVIAPQNAHESLDNLLRRTKSQLSDLTSVLEKLEKQCTGSKIKVISKTTFWYKQKEHFQRFRDTIASIKDSLNLVLSAANAQHMQRVFLELETVTLMTEKSGQMSGALEKGIEDSRLALTRQMDVRHQALSDQIAALAEVLLASGRSGQESLPGTIPSANEPVTNSVRIVASQHRPCRNWCPCSCHAKQKLNLRAPKAVEALLGRVFVGYSGMPLLKEPCNFQGCRDRRQATATVEYWFPTWFLSMNLKMNFTFLSRSGPELQVSTTRRVADDSLSILFARQGDIGGLKQLFAKGLAGPRDVSDSRGYTLVRWALYGGMHNHQTVQFLLKAGALVDETSYDNVWDFTFRNKCSPEQQSALRCITEGGEGDWIEEQNFPLIHRIVFGLSNKSLSTELDENPHSIYLVDAQNRTALDWATARSQHDDMATLIKFGADPNNMDFTGRTAVLHAVDSHNADTLRLILEARGDPNPVYPKGIFRSSPLTAAGFAGRPELLELLLRHEAKPNACNPEGVTALHSIARTHNVECADMLLRYGADPHQRSSNGDTPLTTAIMHNNEAVLKLFLDQWADHLLSRRFDQHEILSVVAEYANVNSLNMLSASQALKASYDLSETSINTSREVIQEREDHNDDLREAFEDLIAVAKAEAEETRSVESILESGRYLSAKTSFHSEIAEALSNLGSVNASPTYSSDDEKDKWEESEEVFYSPVAMDFAK